MSKQKIKGLSAFRLLEGLDDDMILSASLPEAAPIPVPTKGEQIAAFFGRMGKSGVAAAVISVAVIVGVLVGIVLGGRMGPVWPPDTDPSHGVHGIPPLESGMTAGTNDGNNGVLIPPLEQSPEQEKGEVAVISDEITVYPKGYCVWESGQVRNEQGELEGYDTDGRGAVDMLDRLWDSLPVLRTAGNSYVLPLPDHMTLRNIRVFEMISLGYGKAFEEIALSAKGTDPAIDLLNTITRKGDYVVVLDIYSEISNSENEYAKSLYEYAFFLTVDPSMNDNAPVRVIQGDKTYFLAGYPLVNIYYDAEQGKEITQHYDGAEKILEELVKTMRTATVTGGESLSLYLAPHYDLKSIKVYRDLTLWHESYSDEALSLLSEWDAGDYYFIITAVFAGTGETRVTEYPIHIQLVEKEEEIEKPSMPKEYHLMLEDLVLDNGYMLWATQWYDGMLESADGLGAAGQLAELVANGALDEYRLRFPVDTPFLYKQNGVEAPLDWVTVYDRDLNLVGEAPNFTVIHTPPLPAGEYIVILTVKYQGDYIPEADAYEGVCYEYPFILELYDLEFHDPS